MREHPVPVIRAAEATVHHLHDTRFTSYARPSGGSRELCAWRIEIPARTDGVPHHISREEVLYVLSGTLRATVDGQSSEAAAGDVILVPAGARFSVANPASEPASAWVTTTVGFAGVLPDGSWITPPWTQ
jgi:mannose-6-phosphate isomerase-like protein (cupin superfamily)